MDNAIPNPDVSFTRDGTEHRCAELFDRRDNRRACRNCRTLMHYVLGHGIDFPVAADVSRAAAGIEDRDRLHDVVDRLAPCLRPATVPAGASTTGAA